MDFAGLKFWKPGASLPNESELDNSQGLTLREAENEGGMVAIYNPFQQLSLQQQKEALPIYQNRNEILYLVEKYEVVIVIGETGSGKSTQIPQYLYESGWAEGGRVIACTQPRRLAAQELAQRVATEKSAELGDLVGYTVRFEDCSHPYNTRIKFLTDGMLIRETMLDPLLSQYSVIMLDEVHERSLYTDILLGLLKKIQKRRKELRLVISSATLNAEELYRFFNTNKTNDRSKDNVSIISVPGRCFPVEIFYLKEPCVNYLRAVMETVINIHRFEGEGDVLCFLTGQQEIATAQALINEAFSALKQEKKNNNKERQGKLQGVKSRDMHVLPLYAGLPVESQKRVFEKTPRDTRKVILSTNVAETSVTIPGVVFVVDSCFEKIRIYDTESCIEALVVIGCSKSSATQRAGRAGRERAGKVYRLCTENDFDLNVAQTSVPEIQRCNLAQPVMLLKSLGIDNLLTFQFLSPPHPPHLARAYEMLYALGILDNEYKLSPFGSVLVEFPLDPFLAKMLLSSSELKCGEEILSIAAMLSVPNIWSYPKDMRSSADKMKKQFAVHEGDHITLLNVYNGFAEATKKPEWCKRNYINYRTMNKAVEVRNQLKRYARRFGVKLASSKDTVAIRKAIISGFFANAAQMQPDSSYRTVRGNHVLHIHPSSVLFKYPPQWVVYYEVVKTKKEYMRDVTAVEPEWIAEIASHYYDYQKAKNIP